MSNSEYEELGSCAFEQCNDERKLVSEKEFLVATRPLEPNIGINDITQNISKITLPKTLSQNIVDVQKRFYSPEYERMRETLSNISNMYLNVSNSAISKINSILQNSELQNTIKRIIENYNYSVSRILHSSAFQWFKNFDFSSLAEALRIFADLDFDKIKAIYLQEMYDAHWFPYAYWNADEGLYDEIFNIIAKTRKSKNRVKKIDKAIFAYYTKDTIEEIKKQWRSSGIPEHQMRTLHQAVQAYHRKEYALTVIVLTTQWEGIIYNKVHDMGRKATKRTKQHLSNLVDKNDYYEIFNSYFDDFIMYDCNSAEDVIDDVPGRHSAAHNFYDKYPTRKAALNAILFTDFLLWLEPLEEEENNG